ncbi:hypothetical protein FHR83_005724 [Actinoplanes campanulatus]|uniref:Uncharacterized protein n=1 Tax=Actinoplanes campanulatus TaxID=113559 RepID=A0A7W5ALK4_9ACTN|nr:hypothetical protein [Actinoplanes campanulatus]MBB3098039.1 hypothetical protein [Actinoplanes campanulatus]
MPDPERQQYLRNRLRAVMNGQASASPDEIIDLSAGLAVTLPALDLLPLLGWHGVEQRDQLYMLRTLGPELGRDAAACALAVNEPGLAPAHLERARGVVWARLLDTRTDLTELRKAAPGSAARLERCRVRR